MKLDPVSTFTFLRTTQRPLERAKSELARLQTEMATGRLADTGAALGAGAGRAAGFTVERSRLDAIRAGNGFSAGRIEASLAALDRAAGAADALMATLVLARRGGTEANALVDQARRDIGAVTGAFNASQNGEFLFAGVDVDIEPVAEFDPGAPRAAIDAAFLAAFGFAQDDPATAGVSGAAVTAWLDTDFAALFADPAWGATWSSASSTNIEARISVSQRIEVSANSNAAAARDTFAAFAMVAASGLEGMTGEARVAVIDRAMETLGRAAEGLTRMRGGLGATLATVNDASARIELQIDAVSRLELDAVGVDPYFAATRINELTLRIEASYAATQRIRSLSLLDYLR